MDKPAKETPVASRIGACEVPDLPHRLLAAQEEERQRIAAELHDSIGQLLCATLFRLDHLRESLDQRLCDDERRELQDLAQVVSQTVDETRRISMGLRPPMLDDLGIGFTVDWFCNELIKVYSHVALRRNIEVDESRVPPAVRIAVFRIVQEACNNICKHSGATTVTISLRTNAKGMLLRISDNGIGFSLCAARCSCRGLGLRGMQERALRSGGSLRVRSREGYGTGVVAHWPLAGSAVVEQH